MAEQDLEAQVKAMSPQERAALAEALKKAGGKKKVSIGNGLENALTETSKFTGSFMRSAAVTSTIATALPIMTVNPVAGIVYAGYNAVVAYFMANTFYKISRDSLALASAPFLSPMKTIDTVVDVIFKRVLNPMMWLTGIKDLLKLPFTAFKTMVTYPFTTKKAITRMVQGPDGKPEKVKEYIEYDSVFGRTMGGFVGGGLGLYFAAPEIMHSVLSYLPGGEQMFNKASSITQNAVIAAQEKISRIPDMIPDSLLHKLAPTYAATH